MNNVHAEKGMKLYKKPYEYHLLEHIEKHYSKKPGNIIDIGAHVGNHSVYFGLFCADKVFAFEPNENNIKCFHRNIRANELKNVKLYPVALGDINCKMGMNCPAIHPFNLNYWMEGIGDYDVCRLDDYELTDIKLMKIDVEGFDYRVLVGGVETIKKNRPVIIIEYIENQKKIDRLLLSLGYKKGRIFNQATPVQEFLI